MELSYWKSDEAWFVSDRPVPSLHPAGKPPADAPLYWLFHRAPDRSRATFCVSDPRQLTAETESVRFLAPDRLGAPSCRISQRLLNRIDARSLQAVNAEHPRWGDALGLSREVSGRRRIHLLAVGDVGGVLLTGLKLLGGESISTIGICDLNERTVARWVAEMGQVSWPWNYDALPKVEAVSPEALFRCDVLIFAATKSIPPVDSGVQDVRMAQFAANRPIVEGYARRAREAGFRGLFLVLSDPVDPLCKAAYLASNQGPDGRWDGLGLLPEQIQGLGLGVMNARAAALAREDPARRVFLDEGRCFGPHGQGLVVANSLEHYDDALSRAMTQEVLEANLRIRELGFKPYVAPALSSGVFQLLLLLRGQWHYGSVCLGGVWFGCRNRFTASGLETEALAMPDALFDRLLETETALGAII